MLHIYNLFSVPFSHAHMMYMAYLNGPLSLVLHFTSIIYSQFWQWAVSTRTYGVYGVVFKRSTALFVLISFLSPNSQFWQCTVFTRVYDVYGVFKRSFVLHFTSIIYSQFWQWTVFTARI